MKHLLRCLRTQISIRSSLNFFFASWYPASTLAVLSNARRYPSNTPQLWRQEKKLVWLPCFYLQRRWLEKNSTTTPTIRNFVHIHDCGSSQEVAGLVIPYISTMNAQEISVVFTVLKQFPDQPQHSLMDALAEQLRQKKSSIQARHVAQIFHGAAKATYLNPELMEELAQQSMLPFQMEAFTHSDASTVLLSIGMMIRSIIGQRRKDLKETGDYFVEGRMKDKIDTTKTNIQLFPSQVEFVELLIRRFITITEFDRLSAVSVANALHGIAPCNGIDAELVKALANMAIRGPIFREMTDYCLSTVLSAFGYINNHDPEALELIISEIIHPGRLSLFSEKALITTIQGLSLLKYYDRSSLFQILTEAIRPWRLRKYSHWEFSSIWYHLGCLGVQETSFLDLLMAEGMHPDRLQNCPSRMLFNIMMSMTKLRYRNNDFLHAVIKEITSENRKKTINKKDYPAYVWILGQLQYNNPEDLKLIMSALLETNKLEEMPSKTITSIIYGLARTSVYDPEYCDGILEELVKPERLSNISEHSLASLIHSLGKFSEVDQPKIQQIVEEGLKEERLKNYSEYGLAAVVYGLTKFDIQNKKLLEPVFKEIQKPHRIDVYEPGTLSCLLLGLNGLGSKDRVLLERLALEIIKTEKISALEDSALIGLITAFAEIHFENLEVIEKMLRAIINRQELRKTTNANFSSFISSLGDLRYNNSPELILPIVDELIKRRLSFKNHEVATILQGLSQMDIKLKNFYTLKLFVSEALSPDRTAQYSLQDLSRVYTALSLMEYNGKEMEPLIAKIQEPEIYQNLDFKSLACAVSALGKSGIKDERLVQQLKKEMYNRGREGEITERSITQLIQGIGPMIVKKDYALGQMLLELVHHHFGSKLESIPNINLTSILYGLAQIGIENKLMIYPFIVESIKTRRIQKYSSSGLSTLVFALGQFRFRDEQALLPLLKEICREHRIQQCTSRQMAGNIFSFCNMELAKEDKLAPLLKVATDPSVLTTWSESDLSMLFFTLVKIKPKDGTYLQNALAEVIRPERLERMGDQALNAILFSLTNLKAHARSPEVLRAILDQLSLPGRLEKINGDILGNIAYSLGRLEYCPFEFADILSKEVIKPQRLKEFSETALCNLINAFGKVKYENSLVLNSLMSEMMKPARLPEYHEGHIANIVYALGALRLVHHPFFNFMDHVLSDLREVDKFQPKTLLMVMVTYNLLGQGTSTVVKNVSKSIFSNPKRLSLLGDAQLIYLMNTLGDIQKKEKLKASADVPIQEENEYLP